MTIESKVCPFTAIISSGISNRKFIEEEKTEIFLAFIERIATSEDISETSLIFGLNEWLNLADTQGISSLEYSATRITSTFYKSTENWLIANRTSFLTVFLQTFFWLLEDGHKFDCSSFQSHFYFMLNQGIAIQLRHS